MCFIDSCLKFTQKGGWDQNFFSLGGGRAKVFNISRMKTNLLGHYEKGFNCPIVNWLLEKKRRFTL